MIGMDGKRDPRNYMLSARLDSDDNTRIYIYIYIIIRDLS